MIQFFRVRGSALLLFAAPACSSHSQHPPQTAPVAQPATQPEASAPVPAPATRAPDILVVDSAAKAATLTLETTSAAGAPSALISGSRNGEVRIVVPVGWTVKWNWRNADPSASHSLVVMVQREKLPLEGGRASLQNAMSRMVTEGLSAGQTDQTTFVAEDAGWYWLMCGVPSHALAGEWIELRVDPEATTAKVIRK
jgi:Sulfocyanin (SoxE) domain